MKIRKLLPCFILTIAVLGLFAPAFIGWLGIFHDDQAMVEFPWHYFIARHFQNGTIPLWEPDTWCGAIPFYARYYADTYYFPLWPFYLATRLGDLTQAYWMLSLIPLLLHYWLAAAGMYIFGRRALRLHYFPAFLTAWVYIFSPIFAYKYVAFPIIVVQAWLPWALALVVSMDRKAAFLKITGLGVIFALLFFAAQPPHVGYSLLLAGVISIALALRRFVRKKGVAAFRGPFQLLAAVIMSFFLAAVFILPVLEGMEYTDQHLSFTYEDMTGGDGSMPPVYLATLFVPDIFGTWTGFNNRNWVESVAPGVRFWDANMSGGVLLIFLVFSAIILGLRRHGRPGLRFWVILGVCLWIFAILCMLGKHTPFYYLFYKIVPVLSDFPFPIRYVMIQSVVTAWLAGIALEILIYREDSSSYPRPRLIWGYIGLISIVGFITLIGRAGIIGIFRGEFALPGLKEIIRRGNLNWFITGPVLYFVAAGILLVIAWKILRWRRRTNVIAGLVMLETAIFAFAAFYFCIFRFHEPQPQQMRSTGPNLHPMIRRVLGPMTDLKDDANLRWATDQPFHDDFARLEQSGSYAFMGYDMKPLEKRFKKAFEAAYLRPVDWPIYWNYPRPETGAFLSNMSVGYLMDSQSRNLFPGGRTVKMETNPDFYFHYNPLPLPRVFTMDRIVECSEEEAMEELVKGDLRRGVFISRENKKDSSNSNVSPFTFHTSSIPALVSIKHFTKLQFSNRISGLDFSNPNKVKVDVDATIPAMLVLTEIWYPGWKARDNGEPVPLYRINYLQRGVWLEGGTHHVELFFQPGAWKIGAIISLVSWGSVLIVLIGWVIRKISSRLNIRTYSFLPAFLIFVIAPIMTSYSYSEENQPPGQPKPNIIFILLDAARADHFSSYGYNKKTTPAIDALGRNGVIFLENFAPATETYESIPLILTSRYLSRPIFQMDCWEWGIKRESPRTIFNTFDDQQIILSSLLSQAGYRTAIFHNHPWFVEKTDLVKSFDESFLFPIKDNDPVDDRMVDAVLSWINKHKKERFLLYYHMMSPHQPYPPKKEDLDFLDREELPLLNAAREKFENRKGGDAKDWTAEELDYFGIMYDSNLKHTDSQIGRLYSGLKDFGLEENTLFIITSDHGELLGQHGGLGHGGLPWDALIHVPLIMVWPPGVPKGLRIGGLTESVDIVPTIIDICGLKLRPGKSLDGVSLRGFFPGPSSGKEAVYTKRSIRTHDYKYIVDRDLLFDLRKDPGEGKNISNSISPGVRKKLKNSHDLFMKDYKSRYQEATRETAPEFPFYFTIREFTLRPKNIYKSQGTECPPIEMLNNNPSGKRWLLNSSDRTGYLICLPGEKGAPPLTLSSHIPEGSYRISLMASPLKEPFPAPEKSAFLVRIGSTGLFKEPSSIKTIPGEEEDPPSYELEYGMVDVKGTKFSLDLDFHPPGDSPFLIFYVAFSPPREDLEKHRSILAGEAKQRKKDLRSLGYLQ